MKDVKGIFGFKETREQRFANPSRQSIEQTEDYSTKKVVQTKELFAQELMNDIDFNTYKAVALSCDNGSTLPTSPAPKIGQWFLHTPTGRSILLMYNGTAWVPIYSFITATIYVNDTSGSDNQNKGTGTGSNAFKTITYALSQLPKSKAPNTTYSIYAAAATYYNVTIDTNDTYIIGDAFTTQSPTVNATCDSWTRGTATASGVTPAILTDTGAFTGLTLKGYFWTKDDTTFYPIIDNDNNTISIADNAITSCTTYKVYPPPNTIIKNTGNVSPIIFYYSAVGVNLQRIKLENDNAQPTFDGYDYGQVTFTECHTTAGTGTNGSRGSANFTQMTRSYTYAATASSFACTLSRAAKMTHTNSVVRIASGVATCMRVNQTSLITGNPAYYYSEGSPSGTGYTLLTGGTTLFGQWFKNFTTGVSADSGAVITYQNPIWATFVSCTTNVNKVYETFSGSIKLSAAPTVVNGSVSGTATYSEPFTGDYFKKVIVYCNALNGTASYTFPVAFTNTPVIMTTNSLAAAVVTTLNTTTCTITGAPSTGFIILEGY